MKSVYRLSSFGIAALLSLVCCLLSAPASAQSAPKDTVVATVNGEAIYLSQLDKGIPSDSFEMSADQLRRVTLSRLIYYVKLRQFLKSKKVTTSDAEVQEEMARLERRPPLMGCPCHRYRSLNEFLEAGGVSRAELTDIIRNDIGLKNYIQAEWERRYPTPASRAHLRNAAAAKLNKEYTEASHIFFSTYQAAQPNLDPATMSARAKAKSEAAAKRLQRGESFAKIAKEMSEDATSAENGGSLGVISRSYYGREFEEALKTLKPGEVSKPIRSAFGYHIVKWAPVGDKDLEGTVRLDFDVDVKEEVYAELEKVDVQLTDALGGRRRKG